MLQDYWLLADYRQLAAIAITMSNGMLALDGCCLSFFPFLSQLIWIQDNLKQGSGQLESLEALFNALDRLGTGYRLGQVGMCGTV